MKDNHVVSPKSEGDEWVTVIYSMEATSARKSRRGIETNYQTVLLSFHVVLSILQELTEQNHPIRELIQEWL